MATQAITNYRGTILQNAIGMLTLKLTDFDGNPITAEDVTLSISIDGGSEVLTDAKPDIATRGFYVYDWNTNSLSAGRYVATWEYTVNGVTSTELQNLVISESTTVDSYLYNGRTGELRSALESYLGCAQCLPIYYEQARPSPDKKTFYFTFPNWNQTPGIRIYLNKRLVNADGSRQIVLNDEILTNCTINYDEGKIIFDNALSDYDVVNIDYNFRWFRDTELYVYLVNAVRTFNSYPPMGSQYSIDNIPDRYIPAIEKQAAVDALRKFIMCLQFQQPQQVFGGEEGASKAAGVFETLKKNYEEELGKIYSAKLVQSYAGLTQTIVNPAYTLPGGRSRWFRYIFGGTNP
jgi:hypothetical protein